MTASATSANDHLGAGWRAASRPELDPTAHDDEESAELYQVNGL